ncbi:DUF2798 domain-containing protein [Rhabdaerophilum sp. SD176]|uniref:DUF2798 domain-containing protein n=1 Tax=Rhabdaerophilum sp. SD176 TaxID=2983548 RepID=UPI0024DF86FD|nr:DUF2798 domain-containing protein [Rhabdaerophilum sp. SD176]
MFPRRYVHLVYGVLQSGLTSGVASGIASLPFWKGGGFWGAWLTAWGIAWLTMLPLVVFAAPLIQKLAHALTRDAPAKERERP